MFKMCVYIHTSQLAWYIHHKSMLANLRVPTYLFFGPMFCCKHWIISGPSFQPGLIRDQVSSSRTSLAPCGWITWILPMPWTTTIADGGSLTRFWKKNGAGVLLAFAHQIWDGWRPQIWGFQNWDNWEHQTKKGQNKYSIWFFATEVLFLDHVEDTGPGVIHLHSQLWTSTWT